MRHIIASCKENDMCVADVGGGGGRGVYGGVWARGCQNI